MSNPRIITRAEREARRRSNAASKTHLSTEGNREPYRGGEIWAIWHRRAMSWRGGQDIAWIAAAVIAKVPCGECRQHTRAYLQANPPDFTAAGYLPWTVAFHNAVNARLGRPSWTVEQARAHWAAAPVL